MLSAPQIVYHPDEDRAESRGGHFKAVLCTEKPSSKEALKPGK